MNLAATIRIKAYGTSEGVRKEWDTRGRGRHFQINPPKSSFETGKPIDLIGYHNSNGAKELKMGRRGIFFAEAPAADYGHVTHRAEISMKNPLVAEEQVNAVEKLWPNEKDRPSDIRATLNVGDPGLLGTEAWWGILDRGIAAEAQKRGYDGLIYTDPEALSLREFAIFNRNNFKIGYVGDTKEWVNKFPEEAKNTAWAKYVKKGNDANSMDLDAAKIDRLNKLSDIFKHKALRIMVKHMKLDAASQFGNTGWQYGRSIARSVGYVPTRTYGGFPTTRGHGRGIGKPRMAKPAHHGVPHIKGPNVHKPNPSGHAAFNVRKPNLSLHHLEGERVSRLKADIGGEPMTGNLGHAHIDPAVWFHPPSLLKRRANEDLRVPTDDPGETKDDFLDVTKRNSKDTAQFRNKLLKRSAPGGLPAQIPARTTLIEPHSGWYQPTGTGMYGAARAARSARLGFKGSRGMFTSFKNRGRI